MSDRLGKLQRMVEAALAATDSMLYGGRAEMVGLDPRTGRPTYSRVEVHTARVALLAAANALDVPQAELFGLTTADVDRITPDADAFALVVDALYVGEPPPPGDAE